ncbi:MAG: cysteine--tRNA ligase [Acidobacteriota bacterium]|nr:cysteine--tRNA ligase [Acidobacteriota bacterium]
MKAPVFSGGALDLIGNTPLIRLRRICPNPNVEIWAKLECANPGGSVKDRVAKSMIEAAETSGDLTHDKVILEATSGNTGIGLALVGSIKGYKVLLAMSEAVSQERCQILAALGADFLRTPARLGTDGAIEAVYRLQRREPGKYFIPDQYNNPANPLAHYNGTALEVWEQTDGRITHLVATMGTSGTLMGMSRRLKELNPDIRIIGVEPYLGHKIQGLKNMKEAYRPGIFDRKRLEEKVNIKDEDAYETSRLLARAEGLFVGMSSGAAAYVALQLAKDLPRGVLVVILPDGGERYLSTTLFRSSTPVAHREPKLELYDTLSRAQRAFEPLVPGKVSMYSCGPTVNAEPTLGLLRRVVVADLLRRYLEYCGYEVKHVMNVTDLDDNTIQESIKQGVSLRELTDHYTKEFMACLDQLSVKHAWKYPRTSEHIEDMASFARRLMDRGYAYERLRSVYFDIGKFPQYGALSGLDLSKIKVGATVDLDEYDKEDPRDFTLFKRATLAEMARDIFCETDWGNVRPSWHVQCATMSTRYLGEEFDIHTAGTDILFPHNENEIAQCAALHGKGPARYWVHSELVLANGKKMSRSAGNSVTLKDILALGYSAREIRYLLLSTHYRQSLNYSEARLQASRAALKRIDAFIGKLRRCEDGRKNEAVGALVDEMLSSFETAMEADLNVPMALSAVFILIRKANPLLARGEIGRNDSALVLDALGKAHAVLAIFDFNAAGAETEDPEIEALISLRDEARERKDYEEADRIREELRRRNIVLEDTPYGTLHWVESPTSKN